MVPFRPINVPLPRILRASPNSRFWRKAGIGRKRGAGVAQIPENAVFDFEFCARAK
jgi:hypothetical protein